MNVRPLVYHLAEVENWPSIQQHGLLSTRRLLDRIGMQGCSRAAVERIHRPNRTILPTGLVIRDQKPMPPAALERCLVGLTASQWYEFLNSRVFFWFDPERLNRQRRACSRFPQVVLRIASDRLLRCYAAQSALTPINTGNARRNPARRGVATFVPYGVWADSAWLSEAQALGTSPRPRSHPPVELTVTDSVPDVMDFVLSVQYLAPNEYLPPHSSCAIEMVGSKLGSEYYLIVQNEISSRVRERLKGELARTPKRRHGHCSQSGPSYRGEMNVDE